MSASSVIYVRRGPAVSAVRRLTALLAACAALVGGCTVGPDFVRPEAPAADRYTTTHEPGGTVPADGQSQRFHPGSRIAADWWRLFGSAKLDALVKKSIENNPGLQSAQAALRQSEYNLRAGYGVFFPQIDAGAGVVREKFSPARFGGSNASIFNLFTLSAAVNYALDVFGGGRRAVESLAAQEDQQRAVATGTYISLTGNVVNTVIAKAAYRAEIRAMEDLIAKEQEQVAITKAQVDAGIAPYLNLVSLQTQVANFQASLPPLKQRFDQAEHLLAILAGQAPAQWREPGVELAELSLPVELPVSLPSDLVRQRPDILAAEARLHEASADIGVATAALFPSFTISGSYGQNGTTTSELFKSGGNFWSVGVDATAPLFHGGTLWFNRKAAQEAYRKALADYRQTVLSAFAQVADTLRALEHDAETVEAQANALAAANEALALVNANFTAGSAGYLQVLVADAACRQAQIGYLQAKAQRYQDTVALYVALGGGWWEKQENRKQ